MKRISSSLILTLLLWLPAQGKSLEKGQIFLSAQAGFTSIAGSVFQFKLESPINRSFSFGFSYAQRQSRNRWYGLYPEENWRVVSPDLPVTNDPWFMPYNVGAMARTTHSFTLECAYHFSFIKVNRLDIFTGLGVGMDMDKGGFRYFSQQLVAGVNYFLTNNFGLGGRYSLTHNAYNGTTASTMFGAIFRLK